MLLYIDLVFVLDMFLFLCKLFFIKREFRNYGLIFFKLLVFCILKELDVMEIRNRV